jgi:hypothetical protein
MKLASGCHNGNLGYVLLIHADERLEISRGKRIGRSADMNKLVNGIRSPLLLLAMMFFSSVLSAQSPGQVQQPLERMTEVKPPSPTGTDPKPQDATTAILAAFDRDEVVGMGAAHGNKDLDDFILHLVRDPAFSTKVNDIAVECGNSLYQPILDRYIAGEDVPLSEARQVWRNTTQPMCGVSAFYEQFFPLIRRINQRLAPGKKLRVLAGDAPIDWSKVKSRGDYGHFLGQRDAAIASVMEKEVLSKQRKALMLFGTAHLYHAGVPFPNAVEIYERDYSGATLVIGDHTGFGNWGPLAKYNNEWEVRLASWPVPSLVQQMEGTWLADLLDSTYTSGLVAFGPVVGKDGKTSHTQLSPLRVETGFSKMVDAFLYLGPRDLLLSETEPARVFLNQDYMAELQRRAAIMGDAWITDHADPEKLLDRDFNPFFYDPSEFQNLTQGGGANSPLPGAALQAAPVSKVPLSNPQPAPNEKIPMK